MQQPQSQPGYAPGNNDPQVPLHQQGLLESQPQTMPEPQMPNSTLTPAASGIADTVPGLATPSPAPIAPPTGAYGAVPMYDGAQGSQVGTTNALQSALSEHPLPAGHVLPPPPPGKVPVKVTTTTTTTHYPAGSPMAPGMPNYSTPAPMGRAQSEAMDIPGGWGADNACQSYSDCQPSAMWTA